MQPVNEQIEVSYQFDAFELDPVRRSLKRNGKAIALKPKVFETLLVLIRNSGRVMDKDELMQQVWPDTVVEEVNLAHNISVLRKALGQKLDENRFIITVPGRGYGFVASVTETKPNGQAPSPPVSEYELTRSRMVVEEETDENEMSDAFESYADGANTRQLDLTVKALPDGAAKSFRHRRSILFLTGSLIALLVAGGILFWRYYSHQTKNDRLAETPFAGTKIKQLTTKGTVRWAVLSHDGKFYAYTLKERDYGKESLWLGQTDGSHDIQLRPPQNVFYYGLAFSPDGKTVYFTVQGQAQSQSGLFKIPVLGGVAEQLSDKIRAYFALSPDGKQIAAFRTNGETDSSALVIANIDGTGMRELLTRPADKPFAICLNWSPDGSLLAVSAVSDSVKESREVFVRRRQLFLAYDARRKMGLVHRNT